jgi:hypothetical protein
MKKKDPLRLRELVILTKCYHLAFELRYKMHAYRSKKPLKYEFLAYMLANDLLLKSTPFAKDASNKVNDYANNEYERQ